MKKLIQIATSLVALLAIFGSTSVSAEVDNCSSFYPKVPYNCDLVRVEVLPAERADFSAFETGSPKASASKAQYRLRSVPRDVAREIRAQRAQIAN